MKTTLKARAEIPKREWVEFEVTLDDGLVSAVVWHAQGCHHLLEEAEKFAQSLDGKQLNSLALNFGSHHSALMISEIFDKLQDKWPAPSEDVEICHCRKINKSIIQEAILLGAHTPEKVRAWTSASSGCGTCRPDVQKLIDERLNSGSRKIISRK